MGKSPDAFRTISEVAEWLDTQAHVLRFWESKFTQVKPVKRAGGRRYYRPADMLLLGGIKTLLHDEGMTIKGVQKVLREKGIKHVSAMSQPLDDDSDEVEITPVEAPEIEDRGQVLSFPEARAESREEAAPAKTSDVEPVIEDAEIVEAQADLLDKIVSEKLDPVEPEPELVDEIETVVDAVLTEAEPEPEPDAEPDTTGDMFDTDTMPAFMREPANAETPEEEPAEDIAPRARLHLQLPDEPEETAEETPGVLPTLAATPERRQGKLIRMLAQTKEIPPENLAQAAKLAVRLQAWHDRMIG